MEVTVPSFRPALVGEPDKELIDDQANLSFVA